MKQTMTLMMTLLLTGSLFAAGLPDWAESAVDQAKDMAPPEDTAIWTLLDETTISLRRNGTWEKRRRLVHRTLDRTGIGGAGIYVIDGDEEATKIKKLKGWHRNQRGKVEKLDRFNIASLGMSSLLNLNQSMRTFAYFTGIGKDSVVAFESREIITNYFSLETIFLMSKNPTLNRVIIVDDKDRGEAVLRPFNLDAWGIQGIRQGNQFVLRQVPALQAESVTPDDMLVYPRVQVGFFTQGDQEPLASWDQMAKWYSQLFREKALPGINAGSQMASTQADIEEAVTILKETISYRQVYLSPARGYEPMAGQDVQNAAFGDCKDMVACLAFHLAKKQIMVHPAMANIADGPRPKPASDPGAYFNHLIGAIPLSKSLGLPAEITVDDQIYLIYDPTDRYTPLGKLGSQYHGRRIMICTDSGAKWAEIPQSALEKDHLAMKMLGQVDANYSFSGMLDIRVEGDAGHLRTTLLQGNDRDFTGQLRILLDIPGHVDVRGQLPKVDADGTVTAQYQIFWPSFFMRDVGGLRLPFGLTGPYRTDLRSNKTRQQPIALYRTPPVTWDITLATPQKLKVASNDWTFDDPHVQMRWQVEQGDALRIQFSRQNQDTFFGADRIEEGLDWWDSYRNEYRNFLVNAAIFYPEG